jgi:hypothetical protein
LEISKARPITAFLIRRRIGGECEGLGGSRWVSNLPKEAKSNLYPLKQRIDLFLSSFHGLGEYGFEKNSGVAEQLTALAQTIDGQHGKLGWAVSDEQGVAVETLNRVIGASSKLLETFTPEFIAAERTRAAEQFAEIRRWHSGKVNSIESDERDSAGLHALYSDSWDRNGAAVASNEKGRAATAKYNKDECVRARLAILDKVVPELQVIYDEAVKAAELAADPPLE